MAPPVRPQGEKHLHANTNDPLVTAGALWYGILRARQPLKTRHRGLANQKLHCSSKQASEVAVMCAGYQLFLLLWLIGLQIFLSPPLKGCEINVNQFRPGA